MGRAMEKTRPRQFHEVPILSMIGANHAGGWNYGIDKSVSMEIDAIFFLQNKEKRFSPCTLK